MRYNFYVTPPTGTEYAVLLTPSLQSALLLSNLPVGVSSIRVLAVDIAYVLSQLIATRARLTTALRCM